MTNIGKKHGARKVFGILVVPADEVVAVDGAEALLEKVAERDGILYCAEQGRIEAERENKPDIINEGCFRAEAVLTTDKSK